MIDPKDFQAYALKRTDRPQERIRLGDTEYVASFYVQWGQEYVSIKATTMPIGMSLTSYDLLEKTILH